MTDGGVLVETALDKLVILVVEDNERLRSFVAGALKKADYAVREAGDGKAAREILKKEFLNLVLLDLNLGDSNGIEILRMIRRQDEELPVIIISSDQSHNSKVDGFDVGCDDYITKPFYVDELLGRVRRILKRARPRTNGMRILDETIESGPFSVDVGSLAVHKNGRPIEMRKKLFELFLFFMRHPDTLLTNEALFDRAWDIREGVNVNSLYVHIRQLRELIEDDPAKPMHIVTVRGAGYMYHPLAVR